MRPETASSVPLIPSEFHLSAGNQVLDFTMNPKAMFRCCDCCDHSSISRRSFLKTAVTGLAAASAGTLPLLGSDRTVVAPPNSGTSETLVTTLYKSLTEEQRRTILFPFDHPLRSKVDNNWFITRARVVSVGTPALYFTLSTI